MYPSNPRLSPSASQSKPTTWRAKSPEGCENYDSTLAAKKSHSGMPDLRTWYLKEIPPKIPTIHLGKSLYIYIWFPNLRVYWGDSLILNHHLGWPRRFGAVICTDSSTCFINLINMRFVTLKDGILVSMFLVDLCVKINIPPKQINQKSTSPQKNQPPFRICFVIYLCFLRCWRYFELHPRASGHSIHENWRSSEAINCRGNRGWFHVVSIWSATTLW